MIVQLRIHLSEGICRVKLWYHTDDDRPLYAVTAILALSSILSYPALSGAFVV